MNKNKNKLKKILYSPEYKIKPDQGYILQQSAAFISKAAH